jgi:hypothetical protein
MDSHISGDSIGIIGDNTANFGQMVFVVGIDKAKHFFNPWSIQFSSRNSAILKTMNYLDSDMFTVFFAIG